MWAIYLDNEDIAIAPWEVSNFRYPVQILVPPPPSFSTFISIVPGDTDVFEGWRSRSCMDQRSVTAST